jgi:hypothetical protein
MKRGVELGASLIGDANATDVGQSYVGVPILIGDEARGVVALYSREQDAFADSDVRLLTTLATTMSVALENARLLDETQRRSRETAALAEVGRDISSTLDLATVMTASRVMLRTSCTPTTARSSCPTRTAPPIARSSRWAKSRTRSRQLKSCPARASSAACSKPDVPSTSTIRRRTGARSRSPAPIGRKTSG